MQTKLLDFILENKIVAIIRGIESDKILDVAQALYNGGIKCMEITFDQTSNENSIKCLQNIAKIKEKYGDKVLVGAGTVMSVEQVHEAIDFGAQIIISPNINLDVIRETKKMNAISMPGAMTPSEAASAYEAGADVIKLFPMGNLGIPYFKAIHAPLSHIKFAAVGGVNVDNIRDFLDAGICCFGIGGNLVNEKYVQEDIETISNLAKLYVERIK
ncbi:bifunctional 4-hydroxy-2-oxoglutarate aldolase/2-dehydro-3-deoxy-phosphogluconate aldolase [Clostridium sp.]|uniref:bifunctional 4-hydroxy-2-oxoglutarate aldolase/2-dehydro-3-deoxy-phosphogluconate aldolase n=1 Tax=Clostridium sp. TaxID=1506 RepID=UPI001A56ACB7|nr:bifunctional 4-hydroxy-2-oxoglutarate aldolase/2-dehydro-3-deoxy-phosphogluconate aldolase [Clostridium sp.]MBK5242376.1 bifunctional 4-hydroxy-2-oxoglutarate aldolase/2-dehydro-3-deoxy-phosphogluconate aldolase [Clostridium sp.]